jgi:hypothetical protein
MAHSYLQLLQILFFALALKLFLTLPIYGESFGNNSLSIPKLGVILFDAGPISHKKPWGIHHLWTFGTSYMQAINYNWWWMVETNFALGKLTTKKYHYLTAFLVSSGVRFNVLPSDFRPHLGLMVSYLHFLGNKKKSIPLNLDWPIFVGLKPVLGFEWLFYSEMALSIAASYCLYVNINEPFRHVFDTTLTFAIYF